MNDIINRIIEQFYKGSKLKPQPAPQPRVGNMNEDDPIDHRGLNTSFKHYIMAEVVAVPPEFEITNHLKMREAAGIFDHEKVNLRELVTVSMGVAASPIFAVLNNPTINPYTCMYFLHIMNELGLVIKSVSNPVKNGREEYKGFLERWDEEHYTYVRGQEVMRMNMLIINLVPLYTQDVMDEAVDAVKAVLEHTEDVKQMKESL